MFDTTDNPITSKTKKVRNKDTEDNSYYGQLNKRNINKVTFEITNFQRGTAMQRISIPMIYLILVWDTYTLIR